MTSIDISNIDKPIEVIHPDSLPQATHDHVAKALITLVERSAKYPDVTEHHVPMHMIKHMSWLHSLVPGIEKLAAKYHIGNYVAVRGSDETFFESMPLYARWVGLL